MELLKIDLTKSDPTYYKAKSEPQLVELGEHYYLTISGQSSPENDLFLNAMGTIYPVAYGIKFLCKAEDNDFTVPKMECHWFVNGDTAAQKLFDQTPRDEWMWQTKIRMPEFVEHDHFFRAMHNAKAKKPEINFDSLKFELIKEGMCAQILHLGSYDEEGPNIEKLHAFIDEQGYKISGYHKEIYLNDPRRVAPEKLKTIIRYQVSLK